jgi:hypothetical protein
LSPFLDHEVDYFLLQYSKINNVLTQKLLTEVAPKKSFFGIGSEGVGRCVNFPGFIGHQLKQRFSGARCFPVFHIRLLNTA